MSTDPNPRPGSTRHAGRNPFYSVGVSAYTSIGVCLDSHSVGGETVVPVQRRQARPPVESSASTEGPQSEALASGVEPTFPARLLGGLVRALKDSGQNVRHFLGRFGLDKNVLVSDARLPHSLAERLYDAAAEQVGDPTFGLHIGASSDPSDHGVFAALYLTRDFALEDLARKQQYAKLLHDASRVWWQRLGDRIYVYHLMEGVRPVRTIDDAIVAGVVSRLRAVLGQRWSALEIWLTYPRPEDTSPYERFFGCPMRFGMPYRAMALPARLVERARPLRKLDNTLERWAQQELDSKSQASSTVDAVRIALLAGRTGGRWDCDAVGASLNVSRRTIERRLKQEDTTFRRVVNELRFELAGQLLQDLDRDLSFIAEGLGFGDVRAFSRAFKRWSGSTPSAFRSRRQ